MVKSKIKCWAIITILIAVLSSHSFAAESWPLIEDPGPLVHVEPIILIGYMLPIGSDNLSITAVRPGPGSKRLDLRQTSKIQGVWTELIIPVKSAMPIGFTATFGYLFPADYKPLESYSVEGQILERNWSTSTTVINAKFSIDYTFSESLTGILGFQYDSYMSNFIDPENEKGNGGYFNKSQGAQINVTGGSPFLGLMYDRGFWSNMRLKTYFIGFPGIPSLMTYEESLGPDYENSLKLREEISSGYFFEGFAQVSTPVWRAISAGGFAKYREFSGKVSEADAADPNDSKTDKKNPGSADVSFLRSNWIFGGVISATF